jgi:hypothetical protein
MAMRRTGALNLTNWLAFSSKKNFEALTHSKNVFSLSFFFFFFLVLTRQRLGTVREDRGSKSSSARDREFSARSASATSTALSGIFLGVFVQNTNLVFVQQKHLCRSTEFVSCNTNRSHSICVVCPKFVSPDCILCRPTPNLCFV